MRPRGDGDVAGFVALLVIGAIGVLMAVGGKQLWKEHVAKDGPPDDTCFWLIRDPNSVSSGICLVDAPVADENMPPKCQPRGSLHMHTVVCAETVEKLAEVAKNAGRRICGQVARACRE